MSFNLNDRLGVDPGTAARAGFEAAAALWSSVLTDPITIRLGVQFSALGAGLLGPTGSTTNAVESGALRNWLTLDAASATDAAMVASLQAGPLAIV